MEQSKKLQIWIICEDGLTFGHIITKGHLMIVYNGYSVICCISLIHFTAFIIWEMACILFGNE